MKAIVNVFVVLAVMSLLFGCSKKNDEIIDKNGVVQMTEEDTTKETQDETNVTNKNNETNENNETNDITGAETGEAPVNTTNNQYKLFMTSPNNWVGDIMPMTDDKGIQLYYLFDTDHNGVGGVGYHPIYKFSTTNLYEYTDDGLAIPFADSAKEPDVAIGTGSFLLADGVYHSFYTGHNDAFPNIGEDKERIMHATSYDNKTWTKIPEDTFRAPEGYSTDNFRDPFVFWSEEEGCYWMLIATRTEKDGGFVARYTSEDLSKWTLQEPLNAPNKYYMMECPDLFKLGDYYYLFYSWNLVTYYAISDSIYGPFIEPENNILDGQAFYAAKTTEYDGKRYLFGFIDRKADENDTNNYSWAGNLCAYELEQNADGTLRAKMPSQFIDYFKSNMNLPEATIIGNASINGTTAVVESDGDTVVGVDFGTLPSTMLLTCKVTFNSEDIGSGFSFGNEGEFDKALGIELDIRKDLLRYDNCLISRMRYADPKVYTSFDFETGTTYDLKLVVENEIIVLYMNDTKVLSNRIYRARGNGWGIFSVGGKTTFSDIEIFVP